MAKSEKSLKTAIFTLVTIVLVIGIFLFNRTDRLALNTNSLTGLATLRSLAKEATPYSEAMTNGKPTLLEFYADWCTTCQGMAPIVKKMHQQQGEKVNLVMLNVDAPQWQKQIENYQVTGIPQFTFLDSQQQIIRTFVGKVPETVLNHLAFNI